MHEDPQPVTYGHSGPMLFGRYRLVSTLSRGARGTVYEAFDPDTRRRVALRVVPLPPASAKRGLLVRLRKQRRDRAIAQLAHANIVALLAQGQTDESQFIATEFVDGLPLPTYLERVGPLPVLQGLALTVQLLAALGFAHGRGQVHGAVQPGNLLVTRTGQLKVAGFGWAAGDPGAPVPGRFHVPLYLAPEQQRGAPADAHADLYSAALVARSLLGGGSPSHPVTRMPPTVAAVFARALAVKPEDRYRDADSLCAALQDAVGAPVWDPAARIAPLASADEATKLEVPVVAEPQATTAQALPASKEPVPRPRPEIESTTSQAVKSEPLPWTSAESAVFSRFAAATPQPVMPEPVVPVMDARVAPIPLPPQQGQDIAKAEPAPIAPYDAPAQATLAPGSAGAPHRRHRKRGFALAAPAAFVLILGAVILEREPAPESVAAANVESSSAPVVTTPRPAPVGVEAAPTVTDRAASVMGAPAVDVPAAVVTEPAPPAPPAAQAEPPPLAVAPSHGKAAPSQVTVASARQGVTVPNRPQVQRPSVRQVTREPQEARMAPARRPAARTDSDSDRQQTATGNTTRGARDQTRRGEPRRPARPQVAQAYDLHVGCRQDAMLTREVCKAIRCASSEFARHPVCVRRIAEQRARDTERELYSGGR